MLNLWITENRKSQDYPFALLATVEEGRNRQGDPIHVSLANALRDNGSKKDSKKLRSIMEPLSKATQSSNLLYDIVEGRDLDRVLALTQEEAYKFLEDSPNMEVDGLTIRCPSWWYADPRTIPTVTVQFGEASPTTAGGSALLDFNIKLTFNGEELTEKEIEEIMSGLKGLHLIRGQWTEIDPAEIKKVLNKWNGIKEENPDGLSFGRAQQLMAGMEESESEWVGFSAGTWLRKLMDELNSPKVSKKIQESCGLNATLRHYQQEGVAWLQSLMKLGLGGILADDMGLGKTIQVIGLMNMNRRKENPHLLVVPMSLMHNWLEEFKRFAPRLKVLTAHSSALGAQGLRSLTTEEINQYDVVIATYAGASTINVLQNHDWRWLIVDEAQAIKNPDTNQTVQIGKLKAEWNLALTGTPIENSLWDLWSIMNRINQGLLGSKSDFKEFLKTPSSTESDRFEPLRRVISPYILRRLKTDETIVPDLPDKIDRVVHCGMSREQISLYHSLTEDLRKALESDTIDTKGGVIQFMTRFMKICNHPSHFHGDNSWKEEDSGKFKELRTLAEHIHGNGEKVLVFTRFVENIPHLVSFLEETFGEGAGLKIHGGVTAPNRRKAVERFQTDDGIRFMVLQIDTAGVGLNLTAASHVIHFDRVWNPAKEEQASARAWRIGQHSNVIVHKFVTDGTIEDHIATMLSNKAELAEDILGGTEKTILAGMSHDEILGLVRLDLNAATAE